MGRTALVAWMLSAAAAAAQPPSAPPEPPRPALVHVQDGRELKPIAGATIRWLEYPRHLRGDPPWKITGQSWEFTCRLRELAACDPEERLERFGSAVLTDANGEASLPAREGTIEIGIRHGPLWGTMRIPPAWDRGGPSLAPDFFVLDLYPDGSLTFRVVGADGQPVAGVPVKLDTMESYFESPPLKRTRSPDGTVTFGNRPVERSTGRPRPVSARFAIPGLEGLRFSPEDAETGSEPVEMKLPACGSAMVSLVLPDGSPFLGTALAALRTGPSSGSFGGREPVAGDEVLVERGIVRFPLVACREEFTVEIRDVVGKFQPESARIAGPRAAGEAVSATVVFGRPVRRIQGRIVDENGQSVAGLVLDGRLYDSGPPPGSHFGESRSSEARTGESGEFSFEIDKDFPPEVRAAFRFQARPEPDRLVAFWEFIGDELLPPSRPDGPIDIGVFVHKAPPPEVLIASGIVRDEEGNPLGDVEFRVLSGGIRFPLDAFGKSDETGRFEIRGRAPERPALLTAKAKERFLPAPIAVEPGTGGLEIVMPPAGRIQGQIFLPPSAHRPWVQVLLEGEAVENHFDRLGRRGDPERFLERPLGSEGRFNADNLRPGKATLRIRRQGAVRDLAGQEGIEVHTGKSEVVVLDLSRLRLCRITIAPPEPMAKRWARVRARPAGSSEEWDEFSAHGEPFVDLIGGTVPWDVEISLEGFRVARLGGVDGVRTVTLEPAKPLSVTLWLPEEFPLPEHPVYLSARLEWLRPSGAPAAAAGGGPHLENRTYVSTVFDARREVTILAPEPGVHRIVVKAEAWHGLRREPVDIPCAEAGEIDIPEGSPPLRVGIRPDAGALRVFQQEPR